MINANHEIFIDGEILHKKFPIGLFIHKRVTQSRVKNAKTWQGEIRLIMCQM